ncbi:glycosyltransferase [Roseovarius autotrophicus]|uniref:glycosyltransferase n=1 Tax=Roseovarius autotrophicus TaxID=2824121 RepID=UPI001B39679F
MRYTTVKTESGPARNRRHERSGPQPPTRADEGTREDARRAGRSASYDRIAAPQVDTNGNEEAVFVKVAIFTNTFSPHVGGVARSVGSLADGLRARGHQVLVVAPKFPDHEDSTDHIVRIPAYQQFAGTDFSVPSPVSPSLTRRLDAFAPDIVHSHHPFLLGGTALRFAAAHKTPIVYTYHTRYDLYGHYVIHNSDITRRLALGLSIGYCNLCDAVIAPSKSIAAFAALNGVKTMTVVIPTGVNTVPLYENDTAGLRARYAIPPDAFVVGHVGRLAQEKNLGYLTDALIRFLRAAPEAHALIVGHGEMSAPMADAFAEAGVSGRVHLTGVLIGAELSRAYASMDVFAFSSVSETQGLVLIEAMAAGAPVLALDAPGARDVVVDRENARLLARDASTETFAETLDWFAARSPEDVGEMRDHAKDTAAGYSQENTIRKTLDLYAVLIERQPIRMSIEDSAWNAAKRRLAEQWHTVGRVAFALTDAVLMPERPTDE